MAGATLSALPVVVFFLLVHRKIAFGLTAGSACKRLMNAELEFVHLTKVYGDDVDAVRDLNLDGRRGRVRGARRPVRLRQDDRCA